MEQKFILDVTAGNRMMWKNKQHPNTIYLDQKIEVNPDIVGDFTDLSQFEDESFHLVVFDPPHLVYEWSANRETNKFQKGIVANYGLLRAETWQSEFKKAFNEIFRVLKPYGVLVFKWSNYHISYKRVEALFPIEPLFTNVTNSHVNKRGVQSCSWFCFMKIPSSVGGKT